MDSCRLTVDTEAHILYTQWVGFCLKLLNSKRTKCQRQCVCWGACPLPRRCARVDERWVLGAAPRCHLARMKGIPRSSGSALLFIDTGDRSAAGKQWPAVRAKLEIGWQNGSSRSGLQTAPRDSMVLWVWQETWCLQERSDFCMVPSCGHQRGLVNLCPHTNTFTFVSFPPFLPLLPLCPLAAQTW